MAWSGRVIRWLMCTSEEAEDSRSRWIHVPGKNNKDTASMRTWLLGMRILYSIVYHVCMEIGFVTGGSEKGFIDEDSAEKKLESMYLIISFYLDIPSLVSFVCRNRLGCLGYKYVPSFIVERFITRSTNKLYFLPAIYFSATSPLFFSFRRVLSSWSRTHHIRVTWSAGKFSFTE